MTLLSCANAKDEQQALATNFHPNSQIITGKLLALKLKKLRFYKEDLTKHIKFEILEKGVREFEKFVKLPVRGLIKHENNLFSMQPKTWEKLDEIKLSRKREKTHLKAEEALINSLSVDQRARILSISKSTASNTGLATNEIKKIQRALKTLNIYRGTIDGKLGQKTKDAIKEIHWLLDYQGELDVAIADQIALAANTIPPNTKIVRQKSRSHRGQHKAGRLPTRQIKIPKLPANIDGIDIYAVEKLSCEGPNGGWALVYDGTVKKKYKNKALIQLKKRYGFRFNPRKTGINSSDWYCVPRRRICYSEVDFSDWKGKHDKGDQVTFRRSKLLPKASGIKLAIGTTIKKKCNL